MHTNIPLKRQPAKASRSRPRATVCLPVPIDLGEHRLLLQALLSPHVAIGEAGEETCADPGHPGRAQGQWASGVWSKAGEQEE